VVGEKGKVGGGGCSLCGRLGSRTPSQAVSERSHADSFWTKNNKCPLAQGAARQKRTAE